MTPGARALHDLATWAAGLQLTDVPADVRNRVSTVLLDLTAANLAGSRDPGMAEMAEALAARSGPATLVGTPHTADAAAAALFNATATVALEMDEGNQFARAHPGAHVWPAVLAEAEATGASGAEALLAFITGYEVAARVGVATVLGPDVHPHGTAVAVGAAAALAKLRGYAPADFAAAVCQSASLCVPAAWSAALNGATVRNLFAGVAVHNAFVAADSVRWGVGHDPDALESVFGKVLGTFDAARLAADLGDIWYVARGYFKVHACCQYNHSTVDAVLELMQQHGFAARDVASVRVETYALATKLTNPAPTSTLGAKFSIPYAVAATMVLGDTGPDAFGAAHLGNADILDLARRVQVEEDPALTAALPAERPSRVTVTLHDGRQLAYECRQSRGLADRPFTDEELEAKFLRLAVPVVGSAQAEHLRDSVRKLETLASIAEIGAAQRVAA